MTDEDTNEWDEIRKAGQQKRASNRENSTEILKKWCRENKGVIMFFTEAHLRINERFDFWPGTGKYLDRVTGQYKRGVFNLLKDLDRYAQHTAR